MQFSKYLNEFIPSTMIRQVMVKQCLHNKGHIFIKHLLNQLFLVEK